MDWDRLPHTTPKYLDFGFLMIYESSMLVIKGTDGITMTINPLTGEGILQWAGALKFVSPISGKTLTVDAVPAPGGVTIMDGQLILIRNVEYPIAAVTRTVTVLDPADTNARQSDNLFLGCRIGNKLYIRPDVEISG